MLISTVVPRLVFDHNRLLYTNLQIQVDVWVHGNIRESASVCGLQNWRFGMKLRPDGLCDFFRGLKVPSDNDAVQLLAKLNSGFWIHIRSAITSGQL